MKNRVIKFRAWDANTKMWHEWKKVLNEDTNEWGWRFFPVDWVIANAKVYKWDSENLIRCQFTGLLDKNGKEIYEGDIVSIGDGDRYTVVYQTNRMRFGLQDKEQVVLSDSWAYTSDVHNGKCEDILILGNIFENKELLTK